MWELSKRTKRELNYPHVQIAIFFVLSFIMWLIVVIFYRGNMKIIKDNYEDLIR